MTKTEIKDVIFRVLGRIAPEADFDELKPDDNIQKTLDIDSFDSLTFFIGINEELGVNVPESDYGQLVTLTEIINYLSARLSKYPDMNKKDLQKCPDRIKIKKLYFYFLRSFYGEKELTKNYDKKKDQA